MSWSAGGEWGWSETWPAMGKGKGKKGGKKGKGKNQSYPEEDTWGQSSLTEHTGRIRSQYQLPRKLLKASADTDGSALVKATKMADDAFLSQKNLKRVLSTENTHLLRRPGVGLSEAAGSLQAGAATLAAMPDLDLQLLDSAQQGWSEGGIGHGEHNRSHGDRAQGQWHRQRLGAPTQRVVQERRAGRTGNQMRDLCQSYVFAGHTPTVMVHEPTDATLRQPNPASWNMNRLIWRLVFLIDK